jgi:hypothetical protein
MSAKAPSGAPRRSRGARGSGQKAAPPPSLYKLVVFVPATHAGAVRAALAASGAGALGNYDSCSFSASGVGRFRPLAGAKPHIGTIGVLEEVPEERIETEVSASRLGDVLRAVRGAHCYEAPAVHVSPILSLEWQAIVAGADPLAPPPASARAAAAPKAARAAVPVAARAETTPAAAAPVAAPAAAPAAAAPEAGAGAPSRLCHCRDESCGPAPHAAHRRDKAGRLCIVSETGRLLQLPTTKSDGAASPPAAQPAAGEGGA